MDLLERDVALRRFEAALADAARGEGRAVLIGGEAGIGKTTLVEQFAGARRAGVRVLWGTCDALFTPRPLGPVHDIAAQTHGDLPTLLTHTADRAPIFSSLLGELQRRPVIAVFEDIHWADEATLDLLRFLGRRIARTSAVLVLTYRDDELGASHPLRTVLGDLTSAATTLRIPLAPLSEDAVRALVGDAAVDVAALHRRTGGNPFFVTEVLSNTGAGLPLTIRDAVLGRVARLSPAAQAALEAAAVIGSRIEPWLLAAMLPDGPQAADECLASGILMAAQDDRLAFRHELARQAILESVPPVRRAHLDRQALDALRTSARGAPDPSRLVHHAEDADDREAILAYAPAAARQASTAGAHRSAVALYEVALRVADGLPPADHATLLEAHARECTWSDRRAGAIASVYANLGSTSCALHRFAEAERYLAEGLALTEESDLDIVRVYMLGWQAIVHLHQGRWETAEALADEVVRRTDVSDHNRVAGLLALGRLRARRGDADVQEALNEALTLATRSDAFQHIGPVRAARAEAAWLAGDAQRTLAEADAAYPAAVRKEHGWLAGELAFWRRRAGAVESPPDWVAAPFALQTTGRWQAAADAWRTIGCAYETARALADGDAPAQEEALAIFDRLGARSAAADLRRAMRARGIVRQPRGPRPSTRANRFGLTTRQIDVLQLLGEGLSNAEIATRLHIAPKTAEHHVAAVLAKLDVPSRQAAAKLARSQDLIAER